MRNLIFILLLTTTCTASTFCGEASNYHTPGSPTAWFRPSKEYWGFRVYRAQQYTAAHRSLPFGSVVQVLNLRNKKSLSVLITDRGPFANATTFYRGTKRCLDLNYRSSKELGFFNSVAPVSCKVIRYGLTKNLWNRNKHATKHS